MQTGIYIHVPFCRSKCAYCDFYSFAPEGNWAEDYTNRVIEDLNNWAARVNRAADTLYFGGGTPSLLDGDRIAEIVTSAKSLFGLKNAEITVECNPGDDLAEDFKAMRAAGVNRISIGAQSGIDHELRLLSRRHTAEQIGKTVMQAKAAGIDNISLDIMLGIPKQDAASLSRTIKYFTSLPVTHISAYMLKVEKGTPMEQRVSELPDDDLTADLYLQACRELKEAGFGRYEVSNFCRAGFEGRHNLKYWRCEEYVGIGPSAHSFLDGRRFYYERSYQGYMAGGEPVDDGEGGSAAEQLMLALRLDEGLDFGIFCQKNGLGSKESLEAEAESLVKLGLMKRIGGRYSLTDNGALVSNSCILKLTECL